MSVTLTAIPDYSHVLVYAPV